MNIAENIAKKNKKVYFCCLEMSSLQLAQRIISNHTQINTQLLRTGNLTQDHMLKIAEATDRILKLSLKIDTATRYIEELENKIYMLKDKEEIDVLVVDYLTLLKSKGKYSSRELEVAEISRRLKLLALDIKIPIIILVQLNREAENRVPTMSTIRESGSIEQNCDNIIFLHIDNEETLKLKPKIKIVLAKQRQGSIGEFDIYFDKKFSKFTNKV